MIIKRSNPLLKLFLRLPAKIVRIESVRVGDDYTKFVKVKLCLF